MRRIHLTGFKLMRSGWTLFLLGLLGLLVLHTLRDRANALVYLRATRDSPRLVLCLLNSYTLAAMDFWLRRGVSDEHILQGSVRSEQRSMSQKDMPPCGLRRVWLLASLLGSAELTVEALSHSPTSRDAPSSRLARSQTWRNQCIA